MVTAIDLFISGIFVQIAIMDFSMVLVHPNPIVFQNYSNQGIKLSFVLSNTYTEQLTLAL
jgi:hypothetical protein